MENKKPNFEIYITQPDPLEIRIEVRYRAKSLFFIGDDDFNDFMGKHGLFGLEKAFHEKYPEIK